MFHILGTVVEGKSEKEPEWQRVDCFRDGFECLFGTFADELVYPAELALPFVLNGNTTFAAVPRCYRVGLPITVAFFRSHFGRT